MAISRNQARRSLARQPLPIQQDVNVASLNVTMDPVLVFPDTSVRFKNAEHGKSAIAVDIADLEVPELTTNFINGLPPGTGGGGGGGGIGSVFSSTPQQLTVINNFTNPNLSIVTAPVGQNVAALATGDQIFDYVNNLSLLSNITIGVGLSPAGALSSGDTLQIDYSGANNLVISAPLIALTGGLSQIMVNDPNTNIVNRIATSNVSLSNFGVPTTSLNLGFQTISSLATPVNGSDAATRTYVDQAIITGGTLIFQGGYDASTNVPNIINPQAGTINKGATYVVTTAGVITWPNPLSPPGTATSSINAEVGEVLIAQVDNPASASDWADVQRNTGLATTISAGICSFPATGPQGLPAGDIPLNINSGRVSLSKIDLTNDQVTGNLFNNYLNNGTNASANTVWTGTGGTNGQGSWSRVDLSAGASSMVTGNLPVTNLNSGTNASANTVWRGDATWSLVDLSTATSMVTGNLPVTNLNNGTNASGATFWRGDGTWASPTVSNISPSAATGTTEQIVVNLDYTDVSMTPNNMKQSLADLNIGINRCWGDVTSYIAGESLFAGQVVALRDETSDNVQLRVTKAWRGGANQESTGVIGITQNSGNVGDTIRVCTRGYTTARSATTGIVKRGEGVAVDGGIAIPGTGEVIPNGPSIGVDTSIVGWAAQSATIQASDPVVLIFVDSFRETF